MRIGISIYASDDAQIWSSGITQNILFLAMALKAIDIVDEVFLINGGNGTRLPSGWPPTWHLRMVRPDEVTYSVDLVIIMGASLPDQWLLHVRALGAKIVFFNVGNIYSGLAETTVFGLSERGVFTSPVDAIWIISCHEETGRQLLETLTRKPVYVAPHVWSPVILDHSIARLGDSIGSPFGFYYRRMVGRKPWRIASFEPNISLIKNSFIPMLIIDSMYRNNPESVELMVAFNTFHIKEHITFNNFASRLCVTASNKAIYEPRVEFAKAVTTYQIDAIVSHQIKNELNYLYYDICYGNYPLIHNSNQLKSFGVGFYYPEFSAKSGANALAGAMDLTYDDDFWNDYCHKNKSLIESVSPTSQENIDRFHSLISLVLKEDC